MKLNYDSLVEKVQTTLAQQDAAKSNRGTATYKEKLKLKIGNKYLFRVVPYLKDGEDHFTEKTFYRYYQYNWRDAETGAWKFVVSPRTVGERCPIYEWNSNYRKTATKEEVERLRNILGYREGHYINVYVVSDPDNPDNNGKVKILDCPKTVWDVIENAMRGGLDEQWSEIAGSEVKVAPKIFDLGDGGVNLVINVQESKKRAKTPDYSDTNFTYKNAKLGLTDEQQDEILKSVHDLASVDRILSESALTELFKTSFMPKLDGAPAPTAAAPAPEKAEAPVPVAESTPAPAPAPTPAPAAGSEMQETENVEDFLSNVLGLKEKKDEAK